MASQGFQRVRPAHRDSLVKQYRRLLGERKFWVARSQHPRAAGELARLDAAIEDLAKALPLVAPGVEVGQLKPIRFSLAVPLPGNALKRAALAGLRKLVEPTLDELLTHIIESYRIDLEIHDVMALRERLQKCRMTFPQ